MFARFRNLFSRSKTNALPEEDCDTVTESKGTKMDLKQENTEIDNIPKENGNIGMEHVNGSTNLSKDIKNEVEKQEIIMENATEQSKDTMEQSKSTTEQSGDAIEKLKDIMENSKITTEESKITTEKSNDTLQQSKDITENLKDTIEQSEGTTEKRNVPVDQSQETTQQFESATQLQKDTTQQYENTAEQPKDTLELPKDTIEQPTDTQETNSTTENTQDNTELLKDTKLQSVTQESSTDSMKQDTESPQGQSDNSSEYKKNFNDATKSTQNTQNTNETSKVATEQAAEIENTAQVDNISKTAETASALADKVNVIREATAENSQQADKATTEVQELAKNSEQTVNKDSEHVETEINAAIGGEMSDVEKVASVGNEVSGGTSDTLAENSTVSASAIDNSSSEETNKTDMPLTTNMPTASTINEHLTDDNKNTLNNSSVVVDELATDVSSPVSVAAQPSDAATGSNDVENEPGTIIVHPTGNNDIACEAISNKLKEISEVAEALDVTIRDVQNDTEVLETNSSVAEKKRDTMRSNSSEDWHSRSTEDESFATASEGNFTPHSHSSSFQTASGRTSSRISSGKNSFDADDEAAATSSINMSFDSSEHSFLSAQEPISTPTLPLQQHTKNIDNDVDDELKAHANAEVLPQSDGAMADIEDLHSQSVTPTPDNAHFRSIPVDSETELESSYIAESPPMEVLTELEPVTSVTPEVSTCAPAPTPTPLQSTNHTNSESSQKPNAAWRRSKYYENITKQTIKGFL